MHAGAKHDGASLKDALRGAVEYDIGMMTVTVLPELPMTPTGKIAKSDLAAAFGAVKQVA